MIKTIIFSPEKIFYLAALFANRVDAYWNGHFLYIFQTLVSLIKSIGLTPLEDMGIFVFEKSRKKYNLNPSQDQLAQTRHSMSALNIDSKLRVDCI